MSLLTTQALSHSWARPTGERKARPLEGVAGTGKKIWEQMNLVR